MATKMNGYIEGRVRQNISPNTQWMNSGLRAVKAYNNIESCAGHREDSWEAMDSGVEGCNSEDTSAHSEQTPV